MDKQALADELRKVIEEYLKAQDAVLFDLILRREGRDLFLRIMVDKPQGGITMEECAYLNKEIIRMLDEKTLLQEAYILEVSSPGLDRPLKTKADFLRCLNRRVRFYLGRAVNGKLEICGFLKGVTEESVNIEVKGESIEVPLSIINKAKQEI